MIEISIIRNGILVKDFSTKDIKLITNRVLKNNRGRMFIVTILAIALILTNNNLAYATDFAKLDAFGYKLLRMAQAFGKVIFLVLGVVNVIKETMEGANKDTILKTILKYLIAYGSLYALPFLFDLVEEAF